MRWEREGWGNRWVQNGVEYGYVALGVRDGSRDWA